MSPFSSGLVVSGELIEVDSDDFNRANSATVGNDWIDPGGVGGSWEINTNRLMRNASAPDVSADNQVIRAGNIVDQFMECIPLDEQIGPGVRLAGPPGGYHCFGLGGQVFLEGDTVGALGQHATSLNFSTDRLGIWIVDNLITVFVNDILIIEAVDDTWLQGHRGIRVNTATGNLRVDNARWGE